MTDNFHRHYVSAKSSSGEEAFERDLESVVALYARGYETKEIAALYEVEEEWARRIIGNWYHERRGENDPSTFNSGASTGFR